VVKEVDDGATGDCIGKYIRVRVEINVGQPLRRILRVDVMHDGVESTMLLRYEKLPEHCFRCGILGHVVRDCSEVTPTAEPENFDLLFGPWLKADSPIRPVQFRQSKDHTRSSGMPNNGGNSRSSPIVLQELVLPLTGDRNVKGKAGVGEAGKHMVVESAVPVVNSGSPAATTSEHVRFRWNCPQESRTGV
jgi:hypothetical protein